MDSPAKSNAPPAQNGGLVINPRPVAAGRAAPPSSHRCSGGFTWGSGVVVPAAPALQGCCVVWPEGCTEQLQAEPAKPRHGGVLGLAVKAGKLRIRLPADLPTVGRGDTYTIGAQARPIVFIHVGKTGGGTIQGLLATGTAGRFQIHTDDAGRFCRCVVPGAVCD